MSYDREKMMALATKLKKPSVIPGLNENDVVDATIGMGEMGHSIHDATDSRLQDPALQARCAHWLASGLGQKELKELCSNNKVRISGNKKVLALRLAFKQLPLEFEIITTPKSSSGNVKKRKVAPSGSTSKKNRKKKTSKKSFPSGFTGCKKCGGADHKRCTKLKCTKHPDYEAPKRRKRSDSYDCPGGYESSSDSEGPGVYESSEDSEGGGGDWSGRSGYRCKTCRRSSENVGPRRGFDYENGYCGGCTDL